MLTGGNWMSGEQPSTNSATHLALVADALFMVCCVVVVRVKLWEA